MGGFELTGSETARRVFTLMSFDYRTLIQLM